MASVSKVTSHSNYMGGGGGGGGRLSSSGIDLISLSQVIVRKFFDSVVIGSCVVGFDSRSPHHLVFFSP